MASRDDRKWIAAWAVGGVIAILLEAIVRLSLIAADAWASEWTLLHWLTLSLWTATMLWGEGHHTFHRYVAPRVVRRSQKLAASGRPLAVLLAPFYAMSFFADEPRAVRIAWLVAAFIVAFAAGMHWVPHPWRGIIDAGVVAALLYGIAAIIAETAKPRSD